MSFGGAYDRGVASFVTASFRALAMGNRQLGRVETLLASLALRALDARALRDLTVSLYGARGGHLEDGLFDWEERWFDADLPPRPGKILVGGAGTGRELRHLARLGHALVAFDPVPSFLARARTMEGGAPSPVILAGAYEDLVEPETECARGFASAVESHAPFDAVLLGWGSFTHLVTARDRQALLEKLRTLCPSGPLLGSFWTRADDAPPRTGRSIRLGRRLGALLAGSRPPCTEPDDVIRGHCGFAHLFTPTELHALARSAGYEVRRLEAGRGIYGHMTLWPAEPPV